MAGVPAGVMAAGGLVGGFAVARATGKRPLAGVALVGAGGLAARKWQRTAGSGAAAALTGLYLAAFVGSHPLAKKLGAWPSVATVAGGVALTSWLVADRRG